MRTIIIILLFIGGAATASAKVDCTHASESLPKSATAKKVFEELHSFYKMYGTCLDGESAQSSAAFVTETFAKSWDQLKVFNKIAQKDSGFKKFALASFEPNVTAQETVVKEIIEHTQKRCPKKMDTLCTEIQKACEESLK